MRPNRGWRCDTVCQSALLSSDVALLDLFFDAFLAFGDFEEAFPFKAPLILFEIFLATDSSPAASTVSSVPSASGFFSLFVLSALVLSAAASSALAFLAASSLPSNSIIAKSAPSPERE